MVRVSIVVVLFSFFTNAQKDIDFGALHNFIKGKDQLVDKVLDNQEEYRFQFILTPVFEGQYGRTLNVSSEAYFHPASTVKFPVALLTLEKMNRLGLKLDDVLKIGEKQNCGNQRFVEKLKRNDWTFRRLIEELMIVSDNDNYNALYSFLTPGEMNERLKALGYEDSHIYRSFTGCPTLDQLKTKSCRVIRNGKIIYQQKAEEYDKDHLEKDLPFDPSKRIGAKHENKSGNIVSGPFDFNYNLDISLNDLHVMLMRFHFPDWIEGEQRWRLNLEQQEFLEYSMKGFPKQLEGKYLNSSRYPDNLYKYIVHGEEVNAKVSTSSKIGISYGFTTEIAYVFDERTKSSFFLSISIYTNKNNTVNDGDYEYKEVARPFIARFSNLILQFLNQ